MTMPSFTPPPAMGTPEPPVPTQPVTPVTPVVPPAPARRSRNAALLNGLLALALVVAVGGVAFAAGRATAPAPAASTGRFNGGFVGGGNGPQGSFAPGGSFTPGQGGFRGGLGGAFGGGGGLTLTGTVTKVDASGVTLKTANGDDVTVSTDGSTTYHAATTGTANDVTVGATVDVRVTGRGAFGGGNGNGNGGNGNGNGGKGNGNSGAPSITASDITVHQ